MYSDPAHWDFICYDPEDYLKVRPRRRWRTAGALALTRHAERGQLLERPCTQPAPPAAGLCGTTASGSLLASCPSTRSHIRSMSGATCWTTTSPPATLSMPTRSDRASGERAACVSWRAVAASAGPAEQAAVVEEAAVAGVPHPHPLLASSPFLYSLPPCILTGACVRAADRRATPTRSTPTTTSGARTSHRPRRRPRCPTAARPSAICCVSTVRGPPPTFLPTHPHIFCLCGLRQGLGCRCRTAVRSSGRRGVWTGRQLEVGGHRCNRGAFPQTSLARNRCRPTTAIAHRRRS
jgi:hypothetical protein